MTQQKPAPNKRVVLVSRPVGIAQANDFAIEETSLSPLQDGEVRVANQFLSVDPVDKGFRASVYQISATDADRVYVYLKNMFMKNRL